MDYREIIVLLCPAAEPVERGQLWSKFEIDSVPGCQYVYYCANDEIAAEILVGQIKPYLHDDSGYFVIFPVSDSGKLPGTHTDLTCSFMVVHYGKYRTHEAQAIARHHITQLLEYYRDIQWRYISGIRINNTRFDSWADDGSAVEQYTASITVKAVEPFALSHECYDTGR